MSTHTQGANISEEARQWVIETHDPSFDGWERLAEWLERDPTHLAAYEAALAADEWAAGLLAAAAAPPGEDRAAGHDHDPDRDHDNVVPLRPRRRWFLGAGLAASVLAAVGGWIVFDRMHGGEIVTAPGEHRTVQLADGSRIMLNGATRIRLDRGNPRHVDLAEGEALFEVRHDAANPFVVMAGPTRLLDAGTVFNVVRDRDMLDVAVSHGAVIYEPGPGEIRLNAGEALHRVAPNAAPVLRKAAPQAVGSWQSGQLQYEDATLDQIARDLGRNIGREVRVENGIEDTRFTGTLTVTGSPEDVFARVGPLLGVTFAPDGAGWKMMPVNGPRP
jgi:transmembrane sensor